MSEETDQPAAAKKDCEDTDNKDFADILRCLAVLSPHLAAMFAKNAEQETVRRADTLRIWFRPFLIVIGGLGAMVLGLAGLALWKDKPDLAQTVVGYLITYLGGIGTGQFLKSKAT